MNAIGNEVYAFERSAGKKVWKRKKLTGRPE
jgi:hypothetical protein